METIQQLLQISAKLFQHLTDIPKGEERESYIERINVLLDKRGAYILALKASGFNIDPDNRTHQTLAELDKGIRERLDKVMTTVKEDMKELNNAKKHEQQYINPYSNVSTMDGRYFDNKK